MILYGIIVLLIANVSLSHSACCKEKIQTEVMLDTTNELISKVKSSIPTCKLENASSSHSDCCEKEMRAKALLDAMRDIISKAKSSIPTCTVKEECSKGHFDCADLYLKGYNKSGIYSITPMNRLFSEKKFQVYCDMDTDGGGWTVIQRREYSGIPVEDFFKDWKSYKDGFGSLKEEFWLGNDKIFSLTNQKSYSIRFDFLTDWNRTFANYKSFWINDEDNNFKLHISGYSGNAGDSMMYHDGQPFSTRDKAWHSMENDENCATLYKGGWWYKSEVKCYEANLNGIYGEDSSRGIKWNGERIFSAEMKIRPANFRQVSATFDLSR